MIFTPRVSDSSEVRAEMDLSAEDHAKVLRGQHWEAEVEDRLTGHRYLVRGAACALRNCLCDAVIVRQLEPVLH